MSPKRDDCAKIIELPSETTAVVTTVTARRKSTTKASTPQPFLRFYHSESLREKTLAILKTVEKAKDPTQHRSALSDVIVQLTDSGMDYYFLRPLKVAKAGFFTEQSARIGMAGTTTVLASVIRNIIGGMDKPQLLSICGYVRQLMN